MLTARSPAELPAAVAQCPQEPLSSTPFATGNGRAPLAKRSPQRISNIALEAPVSPELSSICAAACATDERGVGLGV
jgi:hypothetical protein